jgi:hypothetical protein
MKRNEYLFAAVGLALVSLALSTPRSSIAPFTVMESQQAQRVVGGACWWTDVVSCYQVTPVLSVCPTIPNASGNCGDGDYQVEQDRWVARTSLSIPGWTEKQEWGPIHCYEKFSCTKLQINNYFYCLKGNKISNSLDHVESVGLGGEMCNMGA